MTDSAADDDRVDRPAADAVSDEILEIVAKETGIGRERLTSDATIVSLDIASLDLVQAIFALESHFDVEIPVMTGEADNEFGTVGKLVQHVRAAIDAKAIA